ncbi:MAG: hypothetical protein CBD16_04405, partial [Betaproteobacteria bacterium TMED156]
MKTDRDENEQKFLSMKRACNPSQSFVVEACAGSGKTWLICSRILRFLVEGGNPSSILALTFTRKSANEMEERLKEFLFFLATESKQKVLEKLNSIGVCSQNSEKLHERACSLYESFLMNSDRIVICTFHSWYSKILASCPIQFGSYSNIKLCLSTKEFQEKVWQNFLHRQDLNIKENDTEFILLVDYIGLKSIKEALFLL